MSVFASSLTDRCGPAPFVRWCSRVGPVEEYLPSAPSPQALAAVRPRCAPPPSCKPRAAASSLRTVELSHGQYPRRRTRAAHGPTRRQMSAIPVRLSVMVSAMGRPAGTPQPRGRGPRAAATTAGRVRVVLYVTPEHHDRIHTQALMAGMSIGRYVEALAERDDLDAEGRPKWAPPSQSDDVLPLAV